MQRWREPPVSAKGTYSARPRDLPMRSRATPGAPPAQSWCNGLAAIPLRSRRVNADRYLRAFGRIVVREANDANRGDLKIHSIQVVHEPVDLIFRACRLGRLAFRDA